MPKFVVIFFSIILYQFILSPLGAQTNIDSLIQITQSNQPDSILNQALLDISWALKSSKPEQALEYGEKALAMARENNFIKYEAMALKNIGTVHLFISNYEKSENYYLAAIKIFLSISNQSGASGCYNNLGLVMELKGDFDIAMEYYSKSLKIDEKIGNNKGIAASLSNIGNILHKKGDYKNSIEHYIKALKIKEELKDKAGIADTYNNIGALYEKQGAHNEAIKNYQNALVLYMEANEKGKSAVSLHNIAYVLCEQKQYTEALEFYKQALEIKEENNFKNGIATTLLGMAEVYLEQKKYNIAFKHISKSIAVSTEIGDNYGTIQAKIALADYYNKIKAAAKAIQIIEPLIKENELFAENLTQSYSILSNAYLRIENYKKAYIFQEKYITLKDSLENEENTKKILQIQLNYEFDKKQKELEIEQEKQRLNDIAELNKKRLIILILIICLVAIVLIATLIYRGYRIKKRDNYILEKQKKEIEESNEELQLYQEELISQKENLEEQKGIVIKQRDQISEQSQKITDSIVYARRIQNSILPPEELFKDIFSDYFIFYKPKDIVSGDFYWIKETKRHIFLAVADCTGHGVPGAFMSLLGISFLNEIVGLENTNSAEILGKVRDRLKTTLHQHLNINEPRDGMDIGLCVIDKNKMNLQFAGAYNSLLIIRDAEKETSELIEFKGDKMPIGSHYKEDKSFTNQSFKIEPSDKFFLFTDGFIDQFGGAYNRKFLANRFKEILMNTRSTPMSHQKKSLIENLEKWMDDREQIDDILVVGFSL